jgi:aminopeptidase YwaD
MTERTAVRSLQMFVVVVLLLVAPFAESQPRVASARPAKAPPTGRKCAGGTGQVSTAAGLRVCAACIRAHMTFLASDALRGRGSGTPDELLAATYVGAQMEQYGIPPAGDKGTYIQQATLVRQVLTEPPHLHFMTPGDGIPAQRIEWVHGKEMLALNLSDARFEGRLQRVDTETGAGTPLQQTAFSPDALRQEQKTKPEPPLAKGEVVLILGKDRNKIRAAMFTAISAGAVAVLTPASPDALKNWDERGKELPQLPARVEDAAGEAALGGSSHNVFALSDEALRNLNGIPDGTTFYLSSVVGPPETSHTWNAVGKIVGRDPALTKSVILLTAHLDHLGIGVAVDGDNIYNGADDDASGTVAALELTRALALGPKPRRTVVLALFGSEEAGGLGSTWFEAHPPVALADIAANLEFEMIGRPDSSHPSDTLWLTGWERTNLGPALAAHGAKLVADNRPDQHFFMRSDNYVLAKKGVVAQTVSSFGLHNDYHQPSDDLAHIDFTHMTTVIGSLIRPVAWLVNSDFRPAWNAGGKP